RLGDVVQRKAYLPELVEAPLHVPPLPAGEAVCAGLDVVEIVAFPGARLHHHVVTRGNAGVLVARQLSQCRATTCAETGEHGRLPQGSTHHSEASRGSTAAYQPRWWVPRPVWRARRGPMELGRFGGLGPGAVT